MKRKTIATISILLVLLISMYGTVFAQDGTDPTAEPTAEPTLAPTAEPTAVPTAEPAVVPGAKFFKHPVVQLLSLYFDRETQDTASPTDPNAPTPQPGEGEESDSGLGPIGEQIAAYHEQGMGFGVLVKIFAMAESQQAACPGVPPVDDGTGTGEVIEPTCTAVTADELVTAFKSGGMGALFKQYGKPALLGVGHVRKALKFMPTAGPSVEPTLAVNANSIGNGNGNGNSSGKPPKTHTNNGKGKNK